ncbi:hypothetical protein DTO282E5_267 [Paecilomyces variotii]|nr:hypothetical protein DTO282E5_267 [Paecilomyces variotii]
MLSLGHGPRINRIQNRSSSKISKTIRASSPPVAPMTDVQPATTIKCPCTLGDIAKVIRSKNAGPFEITLDVMFEDKATYERIIQLGILAPQRIAGLYDIAVEDIVWCSFFDLALAFKATIPR